MFKKGYKQTQEHKDKIGKANAISLKGHKGYWLGKKRYPETIEKVRVANIGKKCTEETKRKLSLANLGRKLSEETRLKMSIAMRGKPHPNQSGDKAWNWKGGYPNKLWNNRQRRIKKLGNGGSHTLAEVEALKIKYNYMCLCCKQQEPFIKLTEDHIVPLFMGGSNNIDNIQPLCGSCNSRKNANTVDYRPNFVRL